MRALRLEELTVFLSAYTLPMHIVRTVTYKASIHVCSVAIVLFLLSFSGLLCHPPWFCLLFGLVSDNRDEKYALW